MARPADEPQGPAPRWPSGEPPSGGSREGAADGAPPSGAAGPAPAWRGVAPAGLPPPSDAAALAAAEAPEDEGETEILVKGRASLVERLRLGLEYYHVRARAQVREIKVSLLSHFRDLHARELNLSWITDSLAVGGAFRPGDLRRLQAEGVSAILDLRGEAADDAELLARHDIAFLHLPTPDHHALSLEHFERGVDWILEQQTEGRRVYVH